MRYFLLKKLKPYLTILLLAVSMTSLAQTNITKMEYFVDADPGPGLRVDIPLSAAPNLDLTFNVTTSTLSEGFHVLSILAQDAGLAWSQYESKVFFVSQSSTLVQNSITKIEYFTDKDPGYGAGINIPIIADMTLDFLENIATASLSEGFHLLTIRAQDANGQWGLSEHRVFFVNQSVTQAKNDITKIEYFIDADPGHGAGIDVPIAADITLDFLENIPTTSLSEGFHLITIRAQDENGQWSMSESNVFYVNQSTNLAQNNINSIEYFIDADPGQGAGVDVPITAATSLDFLENIPTTSLSEGFHLITVRAQDENGQWSMSQSKIFYVNQSSTLVQNDITEVEYFIDSDPGIGAGIDIPITAATSLDFLENIPTTSLSEGFHVLTVRGQDQNGLWSFSETKTFFTDHIRQIIAYAYTIDTDPGLGLANVQSITPQDDIDITLNIPTGALSLGSHNLIVRAQDENEIWGIAEVTPFLLCDGAVADFSAGTVSCVGSPIDFTDLTTASIAGDLYSWDFDGDGLEDASTIGDASFTYSAVGTYDATLTLDRLGCVSSVTKTVVVNDIPTVIANSTAQVIVLGEEVTLFGSGASTYVWDNGVTDNVAFIPVSTTTYTVIGTDSNGCQASESATITVIFPEINVFEGMDVTGTPIMDAQTTAIDFGVTQLGNDITQSFSIENSGTSPLNINSILVSDNGFNVSSSISIIAIGTAETFDITLNASEAKTFNAIVTISSDDLDEAEFTFPIVGTIQGINIINGEDNSGEILSFNQEVNLGTTGINESIDKTFVIENLSTTDIVTINSVLSDNSVFELMNIPTSVGPSSFDQFTVRLLQQTEEVYQGSISISAGIIDFTFSLTAEVLDSELPEINVFNAVTPNGDSVHDFLKIENITFYPNNEVVIYDRLGDKVFELKGYDNDLKIFVGVANVGSNELLNNGNYYYSISKGDGSKNESGFLFLKR